MTSSKVQRYKINKDHCISVYQQQIIWRGNLKHSPVYTSIKKKKKKNYLGINEGEKKLYSENYKMLLKFRWHKINEKTSECLWIGRFNGIKI